MILEIILFIYLIIGLILAFISNMTKSLSLIEVIMLILLWPLLLLISYSAFGKKKEEDCGC